MKYKQQHDIGASEITGFLIVLGIVTGSVGIAYIVGQDIVNNTIEWDHAVNTASHFTSISSNIAALSTDKKRFTVTVRTRPENVISVGATEDIEISGTNYSYNTLTYTTDRYDVIQSNTAVMRAQFSEDTGISSDPRWTITNETIKLLLVEFTDNRDQFSPNRQTIEFNRTNRQRLYSGTGTDFTVRSSNVNAWETFFNQTESSSINSISKSGNELTVDVDSSTTVIADSISVDINSR